MKKILGIFIAVGLVAYAAYAGKGNLAQTSSKLTAFEVSCGTSATDILPAAGMNSYTEVRCAALGSTAVMIGGADVSVAQGYPVCTDSSTCPENALSVSVGLAHCIVAAGTETLNCIALSE